MSKMIVIKVGADWDPATITNTILEASRAPINQAATAAAGEASRIIVAEGRVKSGRMRDANKATAARKVGKTISATVKNTAPYAIYNELGTVRMSPIRFLERGTRAATRDLAATIVAAVRRAFGQ